jgi:hypothetical protein
MRLLRSFASVACAFASLGTAHAEWQALAFTIEPLACFSQSRMPLRPPVACGTRSVSGMFAFDDANDDGHVVLGELLALEVETIVFPRKTQFGWAVVYSFDYAPQTGLHFWVFDGWRMNARTGDSYRYDSPLGTSSYEWMPTTTTRVYAMPEPGTSWLVIAGAAALAWRRRRPTA